MNSLSVSIFHPLHRTDGKKRHSTLLIVTLLKASLIIIDFSFSIIDSVSVSSFSLCIHFLYFFIFVLSISLCLPCSLLLSLRNDFFSRFLRRTCVAPSLSFLSRNRPASENANARQTEEERETKPCDFFISHSHPIFDFCHHRLTRASICSAHYSTLSLSLSLFYSRFTFRGSRLLASRYDRIFPFISFSLSPPISVCLYTYRCLFLSLYVYSFYFSTRDTYCIYIYLHICVYVLCVRWHSC